MRDCTFSVQFAKLNPRLEKIYEAYFYNSCVTAEATPHQRVLCVASSLVVYSQEVKYDAAAAAAKSELLTSRTSDRPTRPTFI